ncbi:hypothetical protein [Mariniphaga sp.]|uniref:hypothetical protein n=1 Tax=Mariniphaga sp. TaxID=1954475 RepID=UPI00356AE150
MKRKTILLGLFVLAVWVISGCATVYKTSELETSGENYKTIAILPFEVTVQYNRLPKNVTSEQIRENEYELGFVFQNQIYNRFLQKKHKFAVNFQDVDKTNMMLRRNQIDIYNLGEFSKDELARLLEVDEVISAHVITSKPMSTGAALAVGILFDIWGPTNTAEVTVSLHSGKNSELLWRFNHVYSGGVGSSPEQLTHAMMGPVSRKFPYKS